MAQSSATKEQTQVNPYSSLSDPKPQPGETIVTDPIASYSVTESPTRAAVAKVYSSAEMARIMKSAVPLGRPLTAEEEMRKARNCAKAKAIKAGKAAAAAAVNTAG